MRFAPPLPGNFRRPEFGNTPSSSSAVASSSQAAAAAPPVSVVAGSGAVADRVFPSLSPQCRNDIFLPLVKFWHKVIWSDSNKASRMVARQDTVCLKRARARRLRRRRRAAKTRESERAGAGGRASRASCWACAAAAASEELQVRLGPRVKVAKSLILCKEYTTEHDGGGNCGCRGGVRKEEGKERRRFEE